MFAKKGKIRKIYAKRSKTIFQKSMQKRAEMQKRHIGTFDVKII